MITISDSAARRARDDTSGDAIVAWLTGLEVDVTMRTTIPDDSEAIAAVLLTAIPETEVIVTTGGTGLGPRDFTPQAVSPLLDYEVPGMAEVMRSIGLQSTPRAMLSRQLVGVRDRTLILVLPGSTRAVEESLSAVGQALPHALELLRSTTHQH